MKFTLEIELGRHAEPIEVHRALVELAEVKAEWLNVEGESGVIRDTNGNRVGQWSVTE